MLPTWLANLLPGANQQQRPQQLPETSHPTPPTAEAETSSSGPPQSEMELIEQMRDPDMDGYIRYLQQGLGEPPRPALPPVPRGHPDYNKWFDWKRITYLRRYQHIQISSHLTAAEKERIKAEQPEVLLKDRVFIEGIASRTGLYIDMEVEDLIREFHNSRRRFVAMYKYVKERGNSVPNSRADEAAFRSFLAASEAQEKRQRALSRLVPDQACPMLGMDAFIATSTKCSATGLAVTQCCGQVRPKLHLPRELRASERYEAQLAKDFKLFRGRGQRRMRDAQLLALKIRKTK